MQEKERRSVIARRIPMGPEIKKIGELAYAVIGPEGATNFGIVKGHGGSAILRSASQAALRERFLGPQRG